MDVISSYREITAGFVKEINKKQLHFANIVVIQMLGNINNKKCQNAPIVIIHYRSRQYSYYLLIPMTEKRNVIIANIKLKLNH